MQSRCISYLCYTQYLNIIYLNIKLQGFMQEWHGKKSLLNLSLKLTVAQTITRRKKFRRNFSLWNEVILRKLYPISWFLLLWVCLNAKNCAWFSLFFSRRDSQQIQPKFSQILLRHVFIYNGWFHTYLTLPLFCQLYKPCIITKPGLHTKLIVMGQDNKKFTMFLCV